MVVDLRLAWLRDPALSVSLTTIRQWQRTKKFFVSQANGDTTPGLPDRKKLGIKCENGVYLCAS